MLKQHAFFVFKKKERKKKENKKERKTPTQNDHNNNKTKREREEKRKNRGKKRRRTAKITKNNNNNTHTHKHTHARTHNTKKRQQLNSGKPIHTTVDTTVERLRPESPHIELVHDYRGCIYSERLMMAYVVTTQPCKSPVSSVGRASDF